MLLLILAVTGCQKEELPYPFSYQEVRNGEIVVAIYIPNAFTPNGDGVNDRLNIILSGVSRFNLRIFGKSEMVFETTDHSSFWDGKLSSETIAPLGIYTWNLDAEDFEGKSLEFEGEVLLLN